MRASQTVCWWSGSPSVWKPADRLSLQMDLREENTEISLYRHISLPADIWIQQVHHNILWQNSQSNTKLGCLNILLSVLDLSHYSLVTVKDWQQFYSWGPYLVCCHSYSHNLNKDKINRSVPCQSQTCTSAPRTVSDNPSLPPYKCIYPSIVPINIAFFRFLWSSPPKSLTYVIPRAVAPVALCLLQRQYFEGGQGGGAWLGGDHPSEPGHRPRPNVVVVRAHWHTQKNTNKRTRF